MRLVLVLVLALLDCGAASAKPMEFESVGTGGNCHSCEWVRGEGEITAETPVVFEAFVADMKKRYGSHTGGELRLDSPGGSLAAGMKLGELIRKHGYSTGVAKSPPDGTGRHESAPGICQSACAFAFLGGVHRRAQPGEIGVHQFYNALGLRDPAAKIFTSVDLSAQQLIAAVLIEYVFRMGVDPRFLSTASMTAPNSMKFLDAPELTDFKVAWDPSKFQPWTIEPSGQGIVRRANPTMEASP